MAAAGGCATLLFLAGALLVVVVARPVVVGGVWWSPSISRPFDIGRSMANCSAARYDDRGEYIGVNLHSVGCASVAPPEGRRDRPPLESLSTSRCLTNNAHHCLQFNFALIH